MKIILNISIILWCAMMAHAQPPTAAFTYNNAGFRVYRTILNPTGFRTPAPSVDSSRLTENKPTVQEQAKKEPNNGASSIAGLSLYPNPVITDLVIKATDPKFENKDIVVYDVTGKVVVKQKMEGMGTVIDLSGLYSGVYLIKVAGNGTQQVVTRIIKQ
ncbi:MAG: T9SS type A sorting domain-containing protein [Bacteroidota bacterium]